MSNLVKLASDPTKVKRVYDTFNKLLMGMSGAQTANIPKLVNSIGIKPGFVNRFPEIMSMQRRLSPAYVKFRGATDELRTLTPTALQRLNPFSRYNYLNRVRSRGVSSMRNQHHANLGAKRVLQNPVVQNWLGL